MLQSRSSRSILAIRIVVLRALIAGLLLGSGLDRSTAFADDVDDPFLAVLERIAAVSEDRGAIDDAIEYHRKNGPRDPARSIGEVIANGGELFFGLDQIDLCEAGATVIEQHGVDERSFVYYDVIVTTACNAALAHDAVDRAHELCDRFAAVIESHRVESGPESLIAANGRVTLASMRIEALLDEGLLDLAAGELTDMRRSTAAAEREGILDEHSRRLALELETRVLIEAERFEDLLRKIDERVESETWIEDHPAITIRRATAHWWLADRGSSTSNAHDRNEEHRTEAHSTEAHSAEAHSAEAHSAFERAIEIAITTAEERTARRLFCHFLLTAGDLTTAATAIDAYASLLVEGRERSDDRMLPFLRSRLAREQDDPASLERSADEVRTTFTALIEEWRNAPERAGGRGLLHYAETRLLIAEHLLHTARLSGDTAAFEEWLRLESAGSLVRKLGARTPTVAALQERLGDRGALVYLGNVAESCPHPAQRVDTAPS